VKSERAAQRRCSGCRKGIGGGGGETPSESESSGDDEEDEEEGEMIFPHSPLLKNLPSPGDLFVQQMGVPASPRQAKHPRVDAGGVSSLSS
jgi:hypothetical protein